MFVRIRLHVLKPIVNSLVTAMFAATMFFSLSPVVSTSAQTGSGQDTPLGDQALCLPMQIEQFGSLDCADLGPSGHLKELASKGITFPAEPLPISKTPADLANIPFAYALVSNEAVPVYDNLENAVADIPGNTLLASKIKYVSLYQKTNTEKGMFYQIATNEWISGQYIKKVSIPAFQGYVFSDNPSRPFGWAMDTFTTRTNPGVNAAETGRVYYKYNLLQIYDTQVIQDTEWSMVGVDEWIQSAYLARVIPNYTRPQGVTSDRWIEVNLQEQVLLVYDSGKLVFATLISSGSPPFYTQPGVFQIYKMLVNDPMSGSFESDKSDYYYLEDVPYIMYYDKLRALHGAYWNNYLGDRGSHGCVNLSVADAHWLFDWAKEVDFVYVWDPSGKTPTDPSLYGAGGF
jgi:lipoprotein-anchoring transpeptidase ErfK/SrfK